MQNPFVSSSQRVMHHRQLTVVVKLISFRNRRGSVVLAKNALSSEKTANTTIAKCHSTTFSKEITITETKIHIAEKVRSSMNVRNGNPRLFGGEEKDRIVKKRRRSPMWASSFSPFSNIFFIIIFLSWSEPCVKEQFAEGFIPPYSRYTNTRWSKIAADSNRTGQDEQAPSSMSNSVVRGISKRKGSRLQVRRRVKAVLEKARIRTGVRNGSVASSPPPPPRSTPTVVAEAATIGGLGDGAADIVFTQIDKKSTSSSSSSYTKNGTNGATNVTDSTTEKAINGNQSNNTSVRFFEDEELGLQKDNGVSVNGASFVNSSATDIQTENGLVNSKEETTSSTATTDIRPRKPKDFDVIRGDMPSANAFVEPLPFKLPSLSAEQKKKLEIGERVQEQSRMGREGSGYVVLDVEAPPYIVWECLLDFESYPELIPTVRSMQLYTSTKLNTGYTGEKPVLPGTGRETRHYGTPSITRACFVLSKFRLNIAAIHRYTPHPKGDYMEFTLDPSCTNMVLKGAKGTWYTEENPDGRKVSESKIA